MEQLKQGEHLTSILPKLRHYPRLKNYATFAALARWKVLWKPQLRQYATTLQAMADRNPAKSRLPGEIETFFSGFFFLIFLPMTAKLKRQDL
jgi:cellulose synthase/poly-beta-1,6-N-acetylglucosamine synthase-like glycosyltransferase